MQQNWNKLSWWKLRQTYRHAYNRRYDNKIDKSLSWVESTSICSSHRLTTNINFVLLDEIKPPTANLQQPKKFILLIHHRQMNFKAASVIRSKNRPFVPWWYLVHRRNRVYPVRRNTLVPQVEIRIRSESSSAHNLMYIYISLMPMDPRAVPLTPGWGRILPQDRTNDQGPISVHPGDVRLSR